MSPRSSDHDLPSTERALRTPSAPTNAFAAIPAADLDAFLADTDLLTSILTFHVVAADSLDAQAPEA